MNNNNNTYIQHIVFIALSLKEIVEIVAVVTNY